MWKLILKVSLWVGLLVVINTGWVQAKQDSLIVAGGCFWCVESDFEKVPGVISVISGYTGGQVANPTYEQVSSKSTGHFEAAKIVFDNEKVALNTLLDYFWKTIDPTDAAGQFCDKGSPYYTAIFYQNAAQQAAAEQSLAKVKSLNRFDVIATQILPAKPFYLAEDYHQDYYKKNPARYRYYRWSCGREATIQRLWGEVASEQYQH